MKLTTCIYREENLLGWLRQRPKYTQFGHTSGTKQWRNPLCISEHQSSRVQEELDRKVHYNKKNLKV